MMRRVLVLVGLGMVVLGSGFLASSGSATDTSAAPSGPSTEGGSNLAAAQASEASECKEEHARSINERASANNTKTGPIELTVHATDPVLNFGAGRGTLSDYIVLKASQPIPDHIYSTNFEIDSLEPMRRIGSESLESVRLVSPTYTRPHFFNHRKEIGFSLCLKGTHGEPGTYTGQFQFVGPGEISSVTITQTAQMKAEHSDFYLYLAIVLVVTFAFLVIKAYAELGDQPKKKELVIKVFILFGSVAAAGLAMLVVYSQSATWGENKVVSFAALIATAFTAVGLGNTLSSGAGKVTETLDKAKEGEKNLRKPKAE